MYKKILFVLLIFFTSLSSEIEESVIPLVNSLENLQNIERRKFGKDQYKQIIEVLKQKENKVRVSTFNTLFDIYDDNLDCEYRWPKRKARVAEMIHHLQPDVLGVQELYPNQLEDLIKLLDGKYDFYGYPCKGGELNGVFFNTERLNLIDSRYIKVYLNNSLTLLKLQDKKTGKEFAFCNTHLTFSNPHKREREAQEIHRIIKEYLLEEHLGSCPLIFVGDLNTFPNLPNYRGLPFYDGDHIEHILKGDLLVDARTVAILGHVGPLSSFSNQPESIVAFRGTGTPGVFLDHIFVTKEITVLIHAIESGRVNGHFPSDHFPLIADLIF